MVCLGLKPGVAGWKAQTNALSYGGTPINHLGTLSTSVKIAEKAHWLTLF